MVSISRPGETDDTVDPHAFVAPRAAATSRRADAGEQRRHPRYAAWMEATLHDVASGEWQHVMVVDVSLGGAGIQLSRALDGPVRGRVYLLVFEWRLRLCEFFGEVVGESQNLGRGHLHVRFIPGEWKQMRALHAMIASLDAEPGR